MTIYRFSKAGKLQGYLNREKSSYNGMHDFNEGAKLCFHVGDDEKFSPSGSGDFFARDTVLERQLKEIGVELKTTIMCLPWPKLYLGGDSEIESIRGEKYVVNRQKFNTSLELLENGNINNEGYLIDPQGNATKVKAKFLEYVCDKAGIKHELSGAAQQALGKGNRAYGVGADACVQNR